MAMTMIMTMNHRMCGARSEMRVNLAQQEVAPPAVRAVSPAVWSLENPTPAAGTQLLLRQGQPLMPALQACCLRDAFVRKVHVAQRAEQVGGRARHRVHEEREVACLRQRMPDAVVVRCLKDWAPHVGLTWQLLTRRDLLAGGRLQQREDNSCNITRHGALQLKHSDGDREVELWASSGPARSQPYVALLPKREAERTRKEMGSWCGTARPGTQNFLGNTIKMHRALGTRQETPKARRAEPAVSQQSVRQGNC